METAEWTTEELPERWSARAKTEIVLRLLGGAMSWGPSLTSRECPQEIARTAEIPKRPGMTRKSPSEPERFRPARGAQ